MPDTLHHSAFEYLQPTTKQMAEMTVCREAFARLAFDLDHLLPDGSDKTYILRKLRTCAMWANVAITRQPNGEPRE